MPKESADLNEFASQGGLLMTYELDRIVAVFRAKPRGCNLVRFAPKLQPKVGL
jgi:hypothetical protein